MSPHRAETLTSARPERRVGAEQPVWRRLGGLLPSVRRAPWVAAIPFALIVLLLVFWLGGLLDSEDATWERIRESGTWRVGMDPSFPPFESLDSSGQSIGFDIDLAHAIAERWGVRVQIVGLGFDQLIDAVAAHQVDSAISALPRFPERAKEVNFSAPYVNAGIVLAVPPASDIRGSEDLEGRRVAVEWGSSGDAQARALRALLKGRLELVPRESVDAALAAVLAGEAQAAIVDAVSLAVFDRSGERLLPVGDPLLDDPYVIVTPVDAPDLLGQVNAALAGLEEDGTLARLRKAWLSPRMLP